MSVPTHEETLATLDLVGQLYKDMPSAFKDTYTKKQFKTEKRRQRMAGDVEIPAANTPTPDTPSITPDKNGIIEYDTSAYGAGSKRGTTRLSKADIKHLKKSGYTMEQIVAYADGDLAEQTGIITDGEKAEKLLEKYRTRIAAKAAQGDGDGDGDTDGGGNTDDGGDNGNDGGGNTDDGGDDGNDDGYAPDRGDTTTVELYGGPGGTNINKNIGNNYIGNIDTDNDIITSGSNNVINADYSFNQGGQSTSIFNNNHGGYTFRS